MALLKQQLVRGVAGQAGCVFDTIVSFLTGAPGTPGRDWVIHADFRTLTPPYQFNRVVLKNTGKSNNEEIYIGISAHSHSAGFEAGLALKTYFYFDNTLMNDGTGKYNFQTNFWNTTYGNPDGASYYRCFMPFKTNEAVSWENKPPLELWIYSNKSRVILILNTEERYSNGYMGQYIRFVTPQEVPYPLMCFADSFAGGSSNYEDIFYSYLGYQVVDWDSGYDFNRHRRSLIFTQHGHWSFTTGTDHFACNRVLGPVGWSYDWRMEPTDTDGNIGNIVSSIPFNYPDGGLEQVLFPVYIYAYTASQQDYYTLGQLDGVYWAPNQKNTTLSEVGSSDCIIFPDLNRTAWYSWMAIKDTL